MEQRNHLPLGSPYQTIQDVLDGLAALEEALLARRDRRGVFVSGYLQITRELKRRTETGGFRDPAWVGRYLIAFANLYRQALVDYEEARRDLVPKAWQLAFDTSAAGAGLVIQDLMLGINAHINHDLPFALDSVGIDPDRSERYDDHTAVNLALRDAIEPLQERIAALYASGLGVLDHLLGNLDETLTGFSLTVAREQAWHHGAQLADADGEAQRTRLVTTIDRHATLVARLILRPNLPFPWLTDALRTIEQLKPWWTTDVGRAVVWSRTASARGPEGPAPGPPARLDDVIARLDELVEGYDRARDRLAISATVYRRITRRVKATVEAGGFQDPDWMTRLDLLFADRYFHYVELYRAGQLDALPRCWAFAFTATGAGRTTIVQDVVLQIAPPLIYDFPIALVEVGLGADHDRRRHDYEKSYELVTRELHDVQRVIARKYASLISFQDRLTGRFDEMISDMLSMRARRETWADGVGLAAASSETERRLLIRRLDQKAVRACQQTLFDDAPPARSMCEAVRALEEALPGSWTDLVGT